MKISRSIARRVLFFVVGAVAFFGAGYWLGQAGLTINFQDSKPRVIISRELPPGKQELQFSLFWDVWDRLHRDYLEKEKLDNRALIYGAIKGMVAGAGDPYTTFLPPSEQKRTVEDLSGSFEGVGIQIGFRGTQLAVIAPLEGTPAQKAGLKAGDFILFIKDEKRGIEKGTVGIDLPTAVEAIRGPAGTEVKLTVSREGVLEPFEVNVMRAKIDVPSVELSFVGEGESLAHLKLLRFGESTNKEWDTKVSEILKKPGIKGVILDVRNNPGGFLNGAVYFASEFVRSGTIVMQENAEGNRQNFTATGKGRLSNFPTVVLMNKGSASASEIVAGALRDLRGAKLIGEATFGKGTIQEAQELLGGAGLHITTARWLTPNGTWVNEKGLEPDIKVEDKADTEEDEQLQRAVEELVK
ncbi:PDZ domain-containing protein [Candidatus Microgenomates bacterium]|nr:PDZ domain-containing protein [Candidatus Microgenomates bacterium]